MSAPSPIQRWQLAAHAVIDAAADELDVAAFEVFADVLRRRLLLTIARLDADQVEAEFPQRDREAA
jgi:hypothetical protein